MNANEGRDEKGGKERQTEKKLKKKNLSRVMTMIMDPTVRSEMRRKRNRFSERRSRDQRELPINRSAPLPVHARSSLSPGSYLLIGRTARRPAGLAGSLDLERSIKAARAATVQTVFPAGIADLIVTTPTLHRVSLENGIQRASIFFYAVVATGKI